MITVTDKSALLAFVDANRQWHLLPVAAVAASLTRVSGRHSFKCPAGAFSLAFRYCEKLPPGHVKNGLCKMAVLHHRANVQVFHGDPVEAFDQLRRFFMVKMLARALYPQVPERDFATSLPAILTALYFAGQAPLLSRKLVSRLIEMARVCDLFASREGRKTLNADIHSDSLSGFGERRGFRYFANQQSMPAIGAPGDSQLLAAAFHRAAKSYAASPHARNSQLIAIDGARSHFLVFLRESVIAVTALESGKPRVLSALQAPKKSVERFIQALQSVTLNSSENAIDLRQFVARLCQLAGLLVEADRLATGVVHANSLLKGAVINKARIIERLFTHRVEFLIRANAVLEGLDCGIFGISHGVSRLHRDAHWRDLAAGCSLISGRFIYITIGQSMKRQNSEWNANRMRDKIRRSPISITLRLTAEGGGSFHATLWQLHSIEKLIEDKL